MDAERHAHAKLLAANLRRLCKARGNISDVCRDIRINRQQFNKYLSGESLPTSHNMRKICSYFRVSEEALLTAAEPAPAEAAQLHPLLAAAVEDLAAQPPRNLPMGYYFAYYPMIADQAHLVRVLVVVGRRGAAVYFKRYTRMRQPGVATRYYPRGKHVGIVVQKNEMIFMLAVNKVGFEDISLMTFNALMNNSPNLRTGIALVMSPWGPMASRVTLEFLGKTADRRQVLRKCQVLPAASAEIDPLIRKSLVTPASWPTAQLQPYGHMEDWGSAPGFGPPPA